MNFNNALEFLKQHQPLPPDDLLTQEIIDQFDEVREFLLKNPSREMLPLLLKSFGDGDGWGVYQLVDETVKQFAQADVIPLIRENLSSDHRGVVYWNAELAAIFPSSDFIPVLRDLALGPDEDIASASVIAIGQVRSETAIEELKRIMEISNNQAVVDLCEDLLNN